METQEVSSTPDPFDAAVVSDSTYVEPTPETAKPAAPRDASGRFASTKPETSVDLDADDAAEKAEPVAEQKPVEQKADDRRPTNAEARKDPKARIAQQTWDQRESERRAEAAERRAAEAERRLQEALRQPASKAEPVAPPQPERFPRFEEWLSKNSDKTHDDYLDARDEWRDTRKAAIEREQRDLAEKEQSFSTRASSFRDRYAAAKAADPDLESRLDARLFSVKPLSALTAQDRQAIQAIPDGRQRDEIGFLCFLADQWIDSEHAPQLLEHISTHFQRLATLPPNQVIRELAKVEAGIGAASRKDSGSAPKPTASQAKPPIKPLGTTPHTVSDDDGSDDEPVERYIARENAKDRKLGRF